jgi:hypothetical protein
MIGDTSSKDPILQDEEITYLLAESGSAKTAAYTACINIVAKYSRLADKTVGKISIKYSQISAQYQSLADKLLVSSVGIGAIPYGGGIYVADTQAKETDASLEQPSFKRGLMDNERYI